MSDQTVLKKFQYTLDIIVSLVFIFVGLVCGLVERAIFRRFPGVSFAHQVQTRSVSCMFAKTNLRQKRATFHLMGVLGRNDTERSTSRPLKFKPVLIPGSNTLAYYITIPQDDNMRKKIAKPVTIIYIHGGASIFGEACANAPVFQQLLYDLWDRGVQGRILSVEYGLSPESPFPIAVSQCLDALLWTCGSNKKDKDNTAAANGTADGEVDHVAGDPVFLMGDSYGGGACLACIQAAHQLQLFNPPGNAPRQRPISGVVLLSPWVDLSVDLYQSASWLSWMGNSCDGASIDVLTKGCLKGGVEMYLQGSMRLICDKAGTQKRQDDAGDGDQTTGNATTHASATNGDASAAGVQKKDGNNLSGGVVSVVCSHLAKDIQQRPAVPGTPQGPTVSSKIDSLLSVHHLVRHPWVSPSYAAAADMQQALHGMVSNPIMVWLGGGELFKHSIESWIEKITKPSSSSLQDGGSGGEMQGRAQDSPLLTKHVWPCDVHDAVLMPGREHHIKPIADYIAGAAAREYK